MDKAYIVANEQQEREVLEKLEQEGMLWRYSLKKATESIPSHYHSIVSFPYVLKILGSDISLGTLDKLGGYEIVYDGRKEKQMSDKYVVSQGFMNELNLWCDVRKLHDFRLLISDLHSLPDLIKNWQKDELQSDEESNNRLIAIIRWVNGEDVFEVEKPKKWVVRSKETDNKGNYMYGYIVPNERLKYMEMAYGKYRSAYFDTKEEAESWANAHQEVVEVEE